MAADKKLEFEHLPKVAPYYLKAVTTLSGRLSQGETVPDIEAGVQNLTVRSEHLAQYRKVCGFARQALLPITFPHVLAFPLHMAVLTHRDFPLKLLGLVHTGNRITQSRAISVDERLDLSASVGGHRVTDKGVAFDLLTHVRVAGETVWESASTMLSRQKTSASSGHAARHRAPPSLGFEPTHEAAWQVPADTGRRYARAAGDYNPIHLSSISARLFGFPKAIAHGMWTTARVAAALSDETDQSRCALDVAFKKPVFLPSETVFRYKKEEGAAPFALTNPAGDIHHMTGELRSV